MTRLVQSGFPCLVLIDSVLSNQMLLLTRACEDLERERQEREEEKVRYLGEKLPPLQLSGLSLEELKVRVLKKNRRRFFSTAGNVQAYLSIILKYVFS